MIEERLDGFSPDDFKDDDIPFDLNPSDERSEPPPFEELVEAEGERIRAHQEEFAELAVYLERRGITLDDFAIAYEIAHQRKKKDAGPHEIDLVLLEHERTADIPARVWFIDGMITTGFNLVIAKKSIGKSFLVLDMAIAISGGFDFLGRCTTKTGVLYVPTELDRIAVHERIQQYDSLPATLFIHYSWSNGEQALRDAEKILSRGDIRVLIFDMFLPIVPEIETNAYETSSVFLKWRQLAQKYSSALIAVWHAGKAVRSDYMDAAIGTTGLIGQSDSVISLERKRGESIGKLYIGGNHGKEEVLKVIFENCHWHLTVGEGGDFLSTGDSQLIELVNRREKTTPTSAAAVTGRGYDAVRVALASLFERGLIEKIGRGVYVPKPKKTEDSKDLRFSSESENRSEAKLPL